ncbi:MAG: tetratricopeptide repeat protein [Marinilabiliales bacterium]|nr:tetratricopeptide repeat protein [Marinilabiliales bacterium]
MKNFSMFLLFLLLTHASMGQNEQVKELVSEGTRLHDQGQYEEAKAKYHAALTIDSLSTLANYELSYTDMVMGNWDEAIFFSRKVIRLHQSNLQEAFVVLGSCYDNKGEPDKAMAAFEEGLALFPKSNLLNYNLSLTALRQKSYDKAEQTAIRAIQARPFHASSHLVLAAVMQEKGERVKSMLALYYFLLVEPQSKRSALHYQTLQNLLVKGVTRENAKNINVKIPQTAVKDSLFGAAEMMVSMLAVSRLTDEGKHPDLVASFIDATKGLFGILNELKRENTGFWWDFYVTRLSSLIPSGNLEAFCYYLSSSTGDESVRNWIQQNPDKMQQLLVWMKGGAFEPVTLAGTDK